MTDKIEMVEKAFYALLSNPNLSQFSHTVISKRAFNGVDVFIAEADKRNSVCKHEDTYGYDQIHSKCRKCGELVND